jgi:hypothetical protein
MKEIDLNATGCLLPIIQEEQYVAPSLCFYPAIVLVALDMLVSFQGSEVPI